jgi:hypothetical protein
MYSKSISFVLWLTLVNSSLWINNIVMVESSSILDNEYEQVIADRYLFSPFSNESSSWTILDKMSSAWQVVSLPEYHSQSSEGVWLLGEREEEENSSFQIYWLSLYSNGSLINLSGINVTSRSSVLVSSYNNKTIESYTAALISPTEVQLILCNLSDATSCLVVRTIPFPSSLIKNLSKISCGLFIPDLGLNGWLYIGSDSGLYGLDLSTFTIVPFIGQINLPVSSLALSSKHETIFIGTETKLWIEMYSNGTNKWRFEHVNGLIDTKISSLVYNNIDDKLWIGQSTGITLLSPIIMSTGRLHWFFSRLSGEISNPGSDIGHLPFANITSLSVMNSITSDGRIWLGGLYGLMRFHCNSTKENAWRVFNSGRYMPNRQSQVNITSLTVLNRVKDAPTNLGSTAVAITNRGLSILRFQMWTLEKKAQHFQSFIDESSRHVKYGFVSDCGMSIWGDSRSCVKGPNDNDGLWTSMYLGSQIFRYAVTKDFNVKQSAWKHFQSLFLLNQVSG